MPNWQLQRVARPGETADNEPWPLYSPRGQLVFGASYTDVNASLPVYDASYQERP